MRIAQVAPLHETVPPFGYGGTERIVSYLTEELVQLGHDVTLFAARGSETSARLIACSDGPLRTDQTCTEPVSYHYAMLEKVFQYARRFDIVHFHVDFLHYPFSRRHRIPNITTLHGRLDLRELQWVYGEYREPLLISISDSQRKPFPNLNWIGTVYHGLPPDLFHPGEGAGDYLLFLGRISAEKDLPAAIDIAKRAERKLIVAAKMDKHDEVYIQSIIHRLDEPHVEYLGEVGGKEKEILLQNASALIFPIDWPEPFGIVMIEAMACGTPVIARRRGSVPEVVDEGITGFIYETVEEAVNAVERCSSFDRAGCRRRFEERFTAERMALDYALLFEQALARPGARIANI